MIDTINCNPLTVFFGLMQYFNNLTLQPKSIGSKLGDTYRFQIEETIKIENRNIKYSFGVFLYTTD